ncbi:MAG TPA: cytochrome-c oxidase, cbb3-type subunit III [Burkholderiales bacterium]
MSEFTSGFWDYYIAIITLVSVIGCAALLWMQSVRKVQPKADGSMETTGHVWDEDLTEYHHPLPRWWSWLFYLTVVFGLVYLVLYPGLGSWRGVLGWSQVGQLEAETKAMAAKVAPLYEGFAKLDAPALAADPAARAVGQKLFLNHCAQCHASDGGGSRGYPSLIDRDWLWGGTPEAIRTTIAEGRTGVMPPFGAVLDGEGAKDVAHYVMSLSGRATDDIRTARGKPLFAQNCVACHGVEGKGNPALGAPDLADKVWLHGAAETAIIETIVRGRTNQMPPHKDFLTPAKIHLLTGYVYGLGGGVPPPSK